MRPVARNQQAVRNVRTNMRFARLVLIAVGFCGACGSAPNDGSTPASVTVITQAPSTSASGPPQTMAGEADVVVAATIHRLYRATGMEDPPVVDQVKVTERYGTSVDGSFLEPDGRMIGEDVRAAVERALAPSVVAWVGSPNDVMDELVSAEDGTHQGIVWLLTFGEPMIDGRQATIVVDMVCGWTCGRGSTYTLESSDTAGWTVTSTTEGWVA